VPLGVQRGDVQVGVEDLDVGGRLQVARDRVTRAALVEAERHRLVRVDPDQEVLQVQDDVGHVLLHPRQGGELVEGVVEAHLGDGRAGDGREQRSPERIPEGMAEAGLERADGEPLAVAAVLVEDFDGGSLDDQHRRVPRSLP
jgi:hypothetical protein